MPTPSSRPLVPSPSARDSLSPTIQRVARFTVQSFFDAALGPHAILVQPTNSAIVESTITDEQVAGYGVALHPSSETPVAIQFSGSTIAGSSGALYLCPGQVLRPSGRRVAEANAFAGFKWGLPFGWLGGGLANLVVLPSPDAEINFSGDSAEVLFHRLRMNVIPDTVTPVGTPAPNWPLRFPWPSAQRSVGGNLVFQKGQPIMSVVPTRTLLRLRTVAPLAAPATVRIVFTQTDPFDMDGPTDPPVLNLTDGGYVDVTFPANPGVNADFPVVSLADPASLLLGGDFAVAYFIDRSVGNVLAGASVDVVRYGLI
jgi:hypothetical protein